MKTVILAGGRGTRLWPDTQTLPKPMVTIGGQPVLCHIMRRYIAAGIDEFIVCTGHLHYKITDWFTAHPATLRVVNRSEPHSSTITLRAGAPPGHPILVHLIYTGENTATGSRLAAIRELVKSELCFHLCYGDGLADLDLRLLVQHHRLGGLDATMTVVHPPSRFGEAELLGNMVMQFREKPSDPRWINAGFFVLSPYALDVITPSADEAWEGPPLRRLVTQERLYAHRHTGFWQCMDAPRDRQLLEQAWASGHPPWFDPSMPAETFTAAMPPALTPAPTPEPVI